jgi:aminopeptidase N
VTADDPYTVVSNGELVARTQRASATTWHYEQSQPMASYLAAVQIGEYATERSRSGPVPTQLFYPAALRAPVRTDFAPLPRMLKLFERLFGPYPFTDFRVVVTEDDLEIPLEAQGMASYGSNHVDGEHGYDRLIAHELAHQWFGNSVTAAEWKDIWLHEGFACYAEWLWSEERRGPTAAALAAEHWAALDAQPKDIVLADPGQERMFDDRVYKRGALLLHAVRQTVGDAAFFATLRDWTERYRYGNATTRQFVATATAHSAAPLERLFAAWLDKTALPKLP